MGSESRKITELVEAGLTRDLADIREFSRFAAIPSNLEAVKNTLLFASRTERHQVLCGPSGWGKTALVEALSAMMAAEDKSLAPIVLPAPELIRRYRSIDPQHPLIVEDAQENLRRQKDRTLLTQILERRIRSGRSTMLVMTAEPCHSELRRSLPFFGRWTVSRISRPTTPERRVIAELMAKNEGLNLAPPLLTLMASRLNGNGLSLAGALKRLRLEGETFRSEDEVLHACGVLNPYFLDNGSFDLRHTISDCAQTLAPDSQELAVYTMNRVSRLPEDAIARHLDLTPSEVFRMTNRVTRRLGQSAELREQAKRLTHLVIREIS